MSFLEPANLAWLGLLPVLLALYLMKLRRRQVTVTASFLWRQAARQTRVDSFFQRLRVNIFLLLQLLALAALVGGLARPYTLAPGQLAGQVVLLVDCSASMGARFAGGTRFEAALQKARQLVRQAPGGAELMLVALGAQARVLVPFTADRTRLLAELDRLEPQDTEADLASVRPLALSVTLSKPQAEILLLGDTLPPGTLPPNLRFLGFGDAGRNLAISAFQVFEREGKRQAFIAVSSFSPQAESVQLLLYQGKRLLFTRALQVAAGSRRSLTLPVPGTEDEPYELHLGTDDDLAADNRFWSLAPRQQVQRVQLVGTVSRFVEKALVAQPRVRVQRVPEPQGSPALVVWESPPDRLPPGTHLLLNPPAGWRVGALNDAAPLVWEEHRLVAGLPLERGLAGGRQKVNVPPAFRQEVLATAGGQPALVLLRGGDSQAVLFLFDLEQSDLVLSPAFPMLMARLLEGLVGGSLDTAAEALVAGQELSLRSAVPVEVTDPQGRIHELTPRQGRCSTLDTTRAGLYRLSSEGQSRQLAVNLMSPGESALAAAPADVSGASAGHAGQSPSMLEEYWRELAGAALLVLLLEWFLYWGGLRRGV